MEKSQALVAFTRDESQNCWKGEILCGEFPRKIVFVEGAKARRPQGVTPVAKRAFLCEITGQTKPGERSGVLFARPLRPAVFGWVPVGEPVLGVRKCEWRCVDAPDAWLYSAYAPPATEEPEDNRRYAEAQKLAELLRHGQPPTLFCTFGWPDRVESVPGAATQVALVWDELGQSVVDAAALAVYSYGARHGVQELYVSWRDARRVWPVEYVEGSLSALPTLRGDASVTARFRFRNFPEVEFVATVLTVDLRGVLRGWALRLLPVDVQQRVSDAMVALAETPEEVAETHCRHAREQLQTAANKLACWEVPGTVEFGHFSRMVTVSYGESEDGYRPAGSYEERRSFALLSWHLRGEEGSPSQFGNYGGHSRVFDAGITEAEAREKVSRDLASDYAHARERMAPPSGKHFPFGCYADFLPAEERERWAERYHAAVVRLLEEELRTAEEWRQAIVAHRSEVIREWAEAEALVAQAEVVVHEAEEIWRRAMAWGDEQPDRPRLTGNDPEGRRAYAAALHAWSADVRLRVQTKADTERAVVVASAAERERIEREAPLAPWYLHGIAADTVTEYVGRTPGQGLGLPELGRGTMRRLPGEASLVAFTLRRRGGKRHNVELGARSGVEVLVDDYDGRCGRGVRTVIARITDPAWRIEWQHYHDGGQTDSSWADAHGMRIWGSDEVTQWEVIGRGSPKAISDRASPEPAAEAVPTSGSRAPTPQPAPVLANATQIADAITAFRNRKNGKK